MVGRLTGLCLITASLASADGFSTQREAVLLFGQLAAPPTWREAADVAGEAGSKAIYFDGLDYKQKPTRVFAWLGFPTNHTGTVPGIVLVHGGGGTAFKEWVRLWTAKGFAAISIAVEGQTDVRNACAKDMDNPRGWQRHAWAGPPHVGIYGDSDEPLQDQWMYHAVADTVLANSLLRSLPAVDAEKVGIMGISWGGVITSTVIGIDDRFAFGIPTYGCGNLSAAGNQYGRALGNNELYKQVWDPPDSYAFAKSIVAEGKPWCLQTVARMADQVANVEFTSTRPLDHALLISTTDAGVTGAREWFASPATLESSENRWRCTASLPEGTTAWFMNVRSGDLTASSDYQENRKTP